MKFTIDYSPFFNIHDCVNSVPLHDFTTNLTDLLRDMGCDPYYADSISLSLYHSMFHDKVYYHTPIHILYMLYFAQENKIELQNYEKLAIFFHDAIYRPGSKMNENSSIAFMEALLKETGISGNVMINAGFIIDATSAHLREDSGVDQKAWLVMDLDLAGFAAAPKPYNLQNKMIEMEFCQPKIKNYGCSLEVFLQGRMAFLKALKQRTSIYRTELFKTTLNMEVKAQANLDNQINETQRRIELLDKKQN
jgi:predicted metal-dependent HD superfamily phosphohydrolase